MSLIGFFNCWKLLLWLEMIILKKIGKFVLILKVLVVCERYYIYVVIIGVVFCVFCDDVVFCLFVKGFINVVIEVVVGEDVFLLINFGIFCLLGDGIMIVVRIEGWVLFIDVVWVWVDCNCVVVYIMFLEEVGNCFFVVKIVLDVFVEGVVDIKCVLLNVVVCFLMVVVIFVESCCCFVMLGDVDEEVEDIFLEGGLDLLLVIEV